MNRLISVITGLHLLAHSVFGCCSHDGGHASSAPHFCHATAQEACGQHNGPDHQCALPAVELEKCLQCESELPVGPPHVCVHSSCQWLDTKPLSAADILKWDLNITSALVPFAYALVSLEPDAYRRFALSDGEIVARPLRLHLALGVLQI